MDKRENTYESPKWVGGPHSQVAFPREEGMIQDPKPWHT